MNRFECSAAVQQCTNLVGYYDGKIVQCVTNNVDHNTSALDGLGTFHRMGLIATVTPGSNISTYIPLISSVTAEDLAAVGQINMSYYRDEDENTRPMIYKSLLDVKTQDPPSMLDLLWKVSLCIRCLWPAWSSMMQMVNHTSLVNYFYCQSQTHFCF